MSVLDQVRKTIRRHQLADSQTRLLVALSGGSDSVALAHLMKALEAAGELRVAGLAHFNHQLRADADRDERFCLALAEDLGWPILADREDVRARALRDHRSLEDAARTARHEFLHRACRHFAADRIAIGHTRDDQAETFLLRLLRGAGPRGLGGMHPRHGPIVRPLLWCRRSDLRAYLEEKGLQYVEDETNTDVSIPRNRIRAELVPLLERRFNPAIVDVLADEAELARDDFQWMSTAGEPLVAEALTFEVAALRAAPTALRRLAVWRAMTAAAGGRPVSFRHVEEALELIERQDDGGIDVPGHRVERIGTQLVFRTGPRAGRQSSAANLFRYPLSIPGEVHVPGNAFVLSAEPASGLMGSGLMSAMAGNPAVAVVRSCSWTGELGVRNRRPGDRFRPVGLGGQKKLQDFFVDRKVAREDRDDVLLVVDETDRIVWVAGYEIDEAFRVTDVSEPVVILKLRQT